MFKKFYLLLAAILMLCGAFLVSCESEELDHEHEYIEHTIKPTCTEKGKREKYCKICDHTVPLEILEAKGHAPNDWQTKVEPSCTINRVDERICKNCNEVVESKTYEVTGHTFGEYQLLQSSTCTESGLEGQICQVCGETGPTRITEKKQHNYTSVQVGSTCVLGAHTRYTCTSCGDSYGTEYATPIENHTVSENWIVVEAPTCISDGRKKQICTVCGEDLFFDTIPMNPGEDGDEENQGDEYKNLNHSFRVETIPPTETEAGYVLYICKLCGYERRNNYETSYLPSEIYEMIASATVRIEAYGKDGILQNVGSGFFITENGEILTNFHVIAGATSLKIKRFGGDEYTDVTIKGYDVNKDLVVLGIKLAEGETTTALQIAKDSVATGDAIYTLGSPLGVDDIFTSGIVSNPKKNVNGVVCIVFTAPISQGNSGGPLVNTRGEVVGINNKVADNAQNLNFALPISLLTGLDTTAEKTVDEVYTETLASNAFIILKKYVSANFDRIDVDGRYVIDRVVREEGEAAGWNYQMAYSDKTGEIILSFIWIQNGVGSYRAEIIISGIKEEYSFKFYDSLWAQYTMDGVVRTDVQPVKDASGKLDTSVFGGILKFYNIAYAPQPGANTLGMYTARDLFGIAFLNILEQTAKILEESDTQLTLELFNFKEIIVKAPENSEENPEIPAE